jgi:Cell wall-active antibiotics response 4TMS YvqF
VNGRIALGLVLLTAGILGLLEAVDVVEIGYRVWIGALLVAVGVAIVFSRSQRRLLVLAGVILLLAAIPALLVDPELLEGGIGESTETPRSRADLEPFRHGIGKLTVDLTEEGLELDEETIEASVGMGELVVIVPSDVDFTLDAHVGAGNIEALDETTNGFGADLERISGTAGTQEITLDLEVGLGNLRVQVR